MVSNIGSQTVLALSCRDADECAVRPRRDAMGAAIGCGDQEFGGKLTGGRDAADPVAGKIGEPQRAVRPGRDV